VAPANGVPDRSADPTNRIPAVRVAVVDVGSNSVRLLVASVKRRGLRELDRDRVYLRLGDDAYRLGRIGARKLDELEYVAERYAQRARLARVERLETIVTAPGRQSSNVDELVDVLLDATRAPVTVLSADDEGRLAWEGAVASLPDPPSTVAVVDLGGGSCEVAVGPTELGPTWVTSRDAGALRVTSAFLRGERASASQLDWARRSIRELLDGLDAPRPDTALAIGGTARAVAKILGPRFGPKKLDKLADRLARLGAARVIGALDVTRERTETLLGGTLVLAEVARRLDAKLEVGRGGVREGAALAFAREQSAAA
jgi:exopolyphosphatase/guanosine-5'-triphosphate,3'-diphosphate pyrophosphatase